MRLDTFAEQLLFTTVYIETHSAAGGGATATGFVVGVDVENPENGEDGHVLLLVTNKHVVEGIEELALTMVRAEPPNKPILGEQWRAHVTKVSDALWTGHPDDRVDVAVVPIGRILEWTAKKQGTRPCIYEVPSELVATAEQLADLDAMEEVVFVGYPNGLYDRANQIPISRRGMTSTPPYLDYEGLPAFLIDAPVFPGSSGSPVFLPNSGMYRTRAGGMVVGNRGHLLGVVAAAHISRRAADLVDVTDASKEIRYQTFLNLGVVFKPAAITETVDAFLSQAGVHRAAASPAAGSESEAA